MSATITRTKPAIVGIATFKKGASPIHFIDTGFGTGDGLTVIANAHVIKQPGVENGTGLLGVLACSNQAADLRDATIS